MYFFHNFVLYIKSKTIKNNSMDDVRLKNGNQSTIPKKNTQNQAP